jgi:hypothetical protein
MSLTNFHPAFHERRFKIMFDYFVYSYVTCKWRSHNVELSSLDFFSESLRWGLLGYMWGEGTKI